MSEVDSMAELVVGSLRQPVRFEIEDGRKFLALPGANGAYELKQITLENAAEVLMPKVVTQHVKVTTSASIENYVNRFKNVDTVLFADVKSSKIEAVIDYHRESTKPTISTEGTPAVGAVPPQLCLHRVTLNLPFSLEWETWNRASGTLMSHKDFASFLEENSIDIVSPPGADLLEICRDLQVLNNVSFSTSVRDGDYTNVAFAKENDASSKGNVKLPAFIKLHIPVYFGEEPVEITAFMRRKIDDGQLNLGIKLSRAENVRQDEFHRIVDEITLNVDHLTTVYGTPA